LLQAALRWLNHDPPSRREHYLEVLRQIRLREVSAEELQEALTTVRDPAIAEILKSFKIVLSTVGRELRPRAGSCLYVVGGVRGWQAKEAFRTALKFDGQTWTQIAPMSAPRHWLEAAALGGRVYAVGGVDGDHRTLASGEVYDPWRRHSVPVGRRPTSTLDVTVNILRLPKMYCKFVQPVAVIFLQRFNKLYRQLYSEVAEKRLEISNEVLAEAAAKQRDTALVEGRVNKNGIAMIDVIADGCRARHSDGVTEGVVVEIQCPLFAFKLGLDEAINKRRVTYLKVQNGELAINKHHHRPRGSGIVKPLASTFVFVKAIGILRRCFAAVYNAEKLIFPFGIKSLWPYFGSDTTVLGTLATHETTFVVCRCRFVEFAHSYEM
ncbi:Actin-binding protein IPP, partial [Eumeta japonica]